MSFMSKKYVIYSVFFGFSFMMACSKNHKTQVDYVNPYMGNISHLLVPTYPTIHLPNSMLRVYPERADYTSDLIKGLPVIVTSHRGSSAFNISPVNGDASSLFAIKNYTYDNERITPYRYSVYLDEEKVQVDYAPSHQSGIYTIVFGDEALNRLIINTRNGKLETNGISVSGYQQIGKGPTKVFLYLETEQTIKNAGVLMDQVIHYDQNTTEGINAALVIDFAEKQVNLRYGISFISSEQAMKNLKREINTFSVDEIAKKGRDKWNEALSKIEVTGASDNEKRYSIPLFTGFTNG
jgi:putative alpha-1,2-mannosidase